MFSDVRHKLLLPIASTLKAFGLLAFLTVSLTNCGQNAPRDNISLEFEEPFQSDDISAIPLEESDLEAISKQEPTYQIMEVPFFMVLKPEEKYFGRSKLSYIYKKDQKIFEVHSYSEIKESDVLQTQKMTSTFQSESPYTLLKVDSIFTVENLTTKEKVHDENYAFDCQANACTFKSTRNAQVMNVSIPKTRINALNLKAELLPQLIARHKFDMDRVRLNFQVPYPSGLFNTKFVYYFEDPTGDTTLKFTKIIKRFHPMAEEKYSLEKNNYAVDREGKTISSSTDFISHKVVSLNEYETTALYPIQRAHAFDVVPPSGKTFDFAHAIVKGAGRHMLKNNRMQKVTHFPNHSEVELLKDNSGVPDTTAPTTLELTNKKEHYVEPEWQAEVLSRIKDYTDTHDKALSILKYLTTRIRGTLTLATLSFREIFDLKRGDCSEFTKSFVLLARENGIAARKHKGYSLPQELEVGGDGKFVEVGGAHAWANYFSPEDGEWIYADAALRGHKKSKDFYLLDFGIDSPADLESEDYNERPLLKVRFVFDQITRDKAVNDLSKI